jgi:hypothetical protein
MRAPTPPSPNFLARYGIYVMPAAFKRKAPAKYDMLQKALLQAREARAARISRPAFAADMAELRKLNR